MTRSRDWICVPILNTTRHLSFELRRPLLTRSIENSPMVCRSFRLNGIARYLVSGIYGGVPDNSGEYESPTRTVSLSCLMAATSPGGLGGRENNLLVPSYCTSLSSSTRPHPFSASVIHPNNHRTVSELDDEQHCMKEARSVTNQRTVTYTRLQDAVVFLSIRQ